MLWLCFHCCPTLLAFLPIAHPQPLSSAPKFDGLKRGAQRRSTVLRVREKPAEGRQVGCRTSGSPVGSRVCCNAYKGTWNLCLSDWIPLPKTRVFCSGQRTLKWPWWHASHLRLHAYNPCFLAVQWLFNGLSPGFFPPKICAFSKLRSYTWKWRFKCQPGRVNSKAKPGRAEKQVLLVQWTAAVPSHWDLFFGYVLHNHA